MADLHSSNVATSSSAFCAIVLGVYETIKTMEKMRMGKPVYRYKTPAFSRRTHMRGIVSNSIKAQRDTLHSLEIITQLPRLFSLCYQNDCWTHKHSSTGAMGTTVRVLDPDFNIINLAVDFKAVPECKHDGPFIRKFFIESLPRALFYGVVKLMLKTDNEAKNTAAFDGRHDDRVQINRLSCYSAFKNLSILEKNGRRSPMGASSTGSLQ